MKKIKRCLALLLALVNLGLAGASRKQSAHSDHLGKYDQVDHNKAGEYTLSRIDVANIEPDLRTHSTLKRLELTRSPHRTKRFVLGTPEFKQLGPWNNHVQPFCRFGKTLGFKVSFKGHASYGN